MPGDLVVFIIVYAFDNVNFSGLQIMMISQYAVPQLNTSDIHKATVHRLASTMRAKRLGLFVKTKDGRTKQLPTTTPWRSVEI